MPRQRSQSYLLELKLLSKRRTSAVHQLSIVPVGIETEERPPDEDLQKLSIVPVGIETRIRFVCAGL